MENKILLNQRQQSYYLCLPAARDRQIFHSVFAYDALLRYCSNHPDFTLQAYCLFQDEVHLLIHTHQQPDLLMDKIMLSHSQWHQQNINQPGYLFDDQATSRVLVQPRYLPEIVRAVHQLPVQRRLCATPALYAYSSYGDYLDIATPGAQLDKELISTMICAVKTQRLRRLEDFMAQPAKYSAAQLKTGNHAYYYALADAPFITQLLSQYPQEPRANQTDWIAQWDKTLVFLSELLHTDEFTCLRGGRNSHLADTHYLLAWLFHQLQGGPIEIAATALETDVQSLLLNINAIHLHHPARFLRYIEQSWTTQNQQYAA
ncbi:MAG: hypothetical protein H7A09_08370 [Oceanospirillaceae bacterium]|nr:hypothetical protein [Oceanospirillaceae bacterium]